MTWIPSMASAAKGALPDDDELKRSLDVIRSQRFDDLPTGTPPEAFSPAPDEDVGPVPLVQPDAPKAPSAPPMVAAPRGRAPGAIDLGELSDALSKGKRDSALTGISRGADQIIASLGKVRPDSAYWESQGKAAESAPLDALKARSSLEQQNEKLTRSADASDPDSEVNRNGSSFWVKTFGLDKDGMGKDRPKEDVEADRQAFAKILAEHPDDKLEAVKLLEHFKEARGAKKAAVDKSAEDEKTKQGIVDTIARSYGNKYKELTPEVIAALRGSTKENVEKALLNFQNRETQETGARKATSGERQATIAETLAALGVGGHLMPGEKFDPKKPGTVLGGDKRDTLIDMQNARVQVNELLDSSEGILQKHKGVPLDRSSPDFATLGFNANAILSKLMTAEQIKSFTDSHKDLGEAMAGHPGDWWNYIQPQKMPTLLQDLRREVNSSVDQAYRGYGKPVPATPAHETAAVPTGRTKTGKDGKVWEEMSDGSARERK